MARVRRRTFQFSGHDHGRRLHVASCDARSTSGSICPQFGYLHTTSTVWAS